MTNQNTQLSLNGITGGSVLPAADISLSAAPVLPTGAVPIAGQYQDLSDTKKLILVKPGYFWCYTHLQDLPLEKQSIDKRYCQQCYEILVKALADLKEAGDRHKHWWAVQDRRHGNDRIVPVQGQPTHNLSTSNGQHSTVDKLDPSVPIRPIVHPGPKNMALPLDRIAKLAVEGMGSKLIARQLNAEGVSVSYKTIQRLLYKEVVMA